jgi:hypothetical protein
VSLINKLISIWEVEEQIKENQVFILSLVCRKKHGWYSQKLLENSFPPISSAVGFEP